MSGSSRDTTGPSKLGLGVGCAKPGRLSLVGCIQYLYGSARAAKFASEILLTGISRDCQAVTGG